MARNSATSLNCSLTRYLEETSGAEANNGKGQFAAAMLSFLGFHETGHQIIDYRNLEGLMEMLAEQQNDGLLSELRRPCMQCPIRADCLVGKIVLKD
jgi:hypothetical protein